MLYVRPSFQNLAKQNKFQPCFRYWLDCGSGRVDHWWHMSFSSNISGFVLILYLSFCRSVNRDRCFYSKSRKKEITRLESYNDPRPSTNQNTSLKSGLIFDRFVLFCTNTITRNNEPLFKLVIWFVLGRGSIDKLEKSQFHQCIWSQEHLATGGMGKYQRKVAKTSFFLMSYARSSSNTWTSRAAAALFIGEQMLSTRKCSRSWNQ